MRLESNNKSKISYLILCAYLIFAFADNHSALFISDYFIPLLLFTGMTLIESPTQILKVNKFSFRFFVLFVILIIGSLINIDDIDRGTFFSYTVWFLFLFVATSKLPSERATRQLINSFICGALIMSGLVLLLRRNYYGEGISDIRYTIRLQGNEPMDPNYLAIFLCVALSFSLYRYFFEAQKDRKRKWMLFSTIFILLAIVMTGSRGAYVYVFLLAIGVLLQLYKTGKTSKKLFVTFALPIVALLMITLMMMCLPEYLAERLSFASLYDNSNSLRVQHWIAGFQCIQKNPILGYGAMHTMDILKQNVGHGSGAHNTFITFVLHFGLIGFFVICGIYIDIVRKLWRARQYYWIAMMIAFMFVNALLENHLGITFWITTVLLYYFSANKDLVT